MEIRNITVSVEEYASAEELNAQDRELLERAVTASERSYSPYSSFRVGAAVKLSNGEIFTGNNQENAAYPSGMCAERVALFAAQSQYPEAAVTAIALYAMPEDFRLHDPVTPCGGCRQVIAEYEYRHHTRVRIIMGNGNGRVQIVSGADSLLPLVFYLEELKKHGKH